MSDAQSEEERLPWLDAPRGAKSGAAAKKAPPKAARRAQAPIFVLLSLFLIAGIGMMSYFVGRGSLSFAPAEQPVPRPAPTAATPRTTVTLPPPIAPTTIETARRIAEAIPAPPPPPVVEVARPATASKPAKSAPPQAKRVTRPKAVARPVRRAKASTVRRAPVRRAALPPAQLIHATKVIQIGTYRSRRQADAAHRRLVRVYPYMKTLPKVVRPTRPRGSTSVFYRLQYEEYSPDYARILCRNLRAIGRGCAVLPAGR